MFCLGSPLAVFLALRGFRPQGKGTLDHIMPPSLCKRLFNIYHPYDPVVSKCFVLFYQKKKKIADEDFS
jgi:phospholipase DDHD1